MNRIFEKTQGDQGERAFSKILFFSFAGRYSAILLLVAFCLFQHNWVTRAMALLFVPLVLYGLKIEYGVWVNEWRQSNALPRVVILGTFMVISAVFFFSNMYIATNQPAQFTVTILAAIFSIALAYLVNRK